MLKLCSPLCQLVWWHQNCPMAEPVTHLAELQGPPGWWYCGKGLRKQCWGSAVRKQTLKHTRRGGEGKVSAKLAASTAVGKEPGRGCCADGSVHPTAAVGTPKSLWGRLCPAAQTLCPVPRAGHCSGTGYPAQPRVSIALPRLPARCWPRPWGWAAGTGVTGLPDADTGSEPPTQERKTLGSVLLLPPPPLTLPSHGRSAPAGTRGGLGVAPTLGSWDWDLTELQGLRFRG